MSACFGSFQSFSVRLFNTPSKKDRPKSRDCYPEKRRISCERVALPFSMPSSVFQQEVGKNGLRMLGNLDVTIHVCRSRIFGRVALLLAVILFAGVAVVNGQEEAAFTRAVNPYVVHEGSNIDKVDMTNGVLSIDIPLLSYPQRGSDLTMDFHIRYSAPPWYFYISSTIWQSWQQLQQSPAASGDACTGLQSFGGSWMYQNSYAPPVFPTGVNIVHTQFMKVRSDTSYATTYYSNESAGNAGVNFGDEMGGDNVDGSADEEDGEIPAPYNATTNLYCSHTPASIENTLYYVEDANGGKHYFAANTSGTSQRFNFPETVDGSGIAIPSAPWTSSPTVIDRRGIHYAESTTQTNPSTSTLTTTDRFGNTITNGQNAQGQTGWTDTVGRFIPNHGSSLSSDGYSTAGSESSPGVATSDLSHCQSGTTSAYIWIVPASQTEGGSQTYYLCYSSIPIQTNFNISQYGPTNQQYSFQGQEARGSATLLTEVVLPNGTNYVFTYDSYVSLASISLPSGGTINYTYENLWLYNETQSEKVSGQFLPVISHVVATRTVDAHDGTGPHTWTYGWQTVPVTGTTAQIFSGVASVTDPQGNAVIHSVVPQDAEDREQQYYQGVSIDANGFPSGGTLLKTVYTTYTQTGSPIFAALLGSNSGFRVAPQTVTETYANGDTRKRVYSYVAPTGNFTYYNLNGSLEWVKDGRYFNSLAPITCACFYTEQVSNESDYDYGANGNAGALLRSVATNYQWQGADQYQAANLLDLPASILTLDGSGNVDSTVAYAYDETAPISSGLGVGQQFNGAPGAPLGQTTGVCSYLTPTSSPSCSSAASSAYIRETNTYFDTGERATYTDGRGHSTSFAYNQCSGSQLSGETNPIGQTSSWTYDCQLGKKLSYQDPNQATVNYVYADPLGRMTETQLPDGGSTTINYNDNPTPPSLTVTQATGGQEGNIVHQVQYDGLGRTHSVLLTSDPGGVDSEVFGYNSVGLIASVSNPYRSTSDSTYGITSYTYDALGRKTLQTQPDGSKLWWCYDGVPSDSQPNCIAQSGTATPSTWVDYTDEVGTHWQYKSDALGRLTQVVELGTPANPLSLETDYGYNVLNNLTSVTQHGASGETPRTRSFAYDSLARLIASYNPENASVQNPASLSCTGATGNSWTDCYGYDANGNLQTKTDNRNMTTSYFYDALNRLISKTHSDVNTPSSCYEYDFPLGKDAGYNDAGRLVSEWTQPGACPASINSIPSSAINWKYITNYDPMGRILSEQQCPLAPCSNLSPISYGYDLAGNMTSSTNGLPPSASRGITLTYTPDAAGHLAKISSSWGDATHPQTLFEADTSAAGALKAPAAYSPFGGLEAALYGINGGTNIAGLSDVRSYDTRARLLTKSVLGTPGLIPTTVSFSMNPAVFTTAESPQVLIHVSCDSACGQVSLSVDGHSWIPGYDVDSNGNLPGWYNIWYWQTPYLTPGTHSITANYLGSTTYAPSSSNFTVTIKPIGTQQTSVSLSITPTAFTTGENAMVSANVGCNSACGQVEFDLDGSLWLVIPLDSTGNASVATYWWGSTSWKQGAHTITAKYLGNSTYAPVSQTASFTILPTGTQQTSLNLSISPTTFTTVENSMVEANVGCNSACGQVEFDLDGSRWLVNALDSTGNASVATYWWGGQSWSQGTHTITAKYLGNSTFAPSSQSGSFTVVPIGTQPVSVSLSVSPGTTFSVSSEFSFPVHAACSSACTGFFLVTVDGKSWVQVQVDQNGNLIVDSSWAGSALFTSGTHTVKARFLGNSTYAPSDSNVLTVTATP